MLFAADAFLCISSIMIKFHFAAGFYEKADVRSQLGNGWQKVGGRFSAFTFLHIYGNLKLGGT